MNEELQDMILDLRIKEATLGLDDDERRRLVELCAEAGEGDDMSFEIAAAAAGIVDLQVDEPLPAHLRKRISESAEKHFAAANTATFDRSGDDLQSVFTLDRPERSWNWLGWVLAGAACIALAANIWFTRMDPPVIVTQQPPATPGPPTKEQEFALMMGSNDPMTKATWAPGNMADVKEVSGDVVWSDEKQKGYLRLRGLPMNDASKATYQLWIFDKTQDKATPIDGGTFDVDRQGEMIITIDAKLRAREPGLFAITVEKPGGVVVSKRDKIAALATVETPKSSQS